MEDRFILLFNTSILIFAVLIMLSYVILAFISTKTLRHYLKENNFVNYDVLLTAKYAPHLSLIAPAYNEGMTIRENVQSMLALNYTNYEVIVVNDGSKDNTMEILIEAYDLIEREDPIVVQIPSNEIRAVYVPRNPAFKKLVVVDKVNGGKADALNAGINVSKHPYIVCIDVDCVLSMDALLRLAKPFLEQSSTRIIATGGVVRIANSCIVKGGKLLEVNAPDKMLPRIQVLEYLRAFLLGRMAWSKLDGLLLISGAFGMFDKEIAIKSGGYNHKTVGEDMELVVRMRRYMIEHDMKYSVSFIPDPLCWTEAPDNFKIFRKQRSRWTRGTMETLWIHRNMMLNPKYKFLGMISVPYWTVFEYMAPLIEFTGLLITAYYVATGMLHPYFFLLLFLFVYTFAVMFSFYALAVDEFTYHQYPKFKDLRRLLGAAMVEPLYYHPFTIYAALRGNWEKLKGTSAWGEMTRTGFTPSEKK